MAILVKSDSELKAIMERITKEVIDVVADKIYKKFDKKSKLQKRILSDTYVNPPNVSYAYDTGNPTGEFLEAWDWTPTKTDMNKVTKQLFYDWQGMSVDESNWVHGSFDGDARENLADILNLAFNNYQSGFTSNLMWPNPNKHFSKFRHPYWKNLMDELFEAGELEHMFRAEFMKRGIKP